VKIRGPASHVAEKYVQLARDAQSSGDPVAAENYYQHAEHYFRLIAAAQEQFRQNQPYYQQQPAGGAGGNAAEEGYEDGDNEQGAGEGEPFAPRDTQQPFYPREQHNQGQPQQSQQRPQFQPSNNPGNNNDDVDRLPSFITGGGQSPAAPPQQGHGPNNSNGPNGYDGSADRFPLHRRRRRHRGPRDHSMSDEGGDTSSGPRQSDD
jgi:hypothetical protein